MKRLIIVGSPRTNGRSVHLAEMLFETNIDERPEDELFLVPVSEIEVGPCIACDGCREKTPVVLKDGDGREVTELRHRCVFDDDMQTLYDLIDDADEVTVVSPVYFSGAPAPLKCLLDRLQPYYWAGTRFGSKHPASLHVVGEGGDPHGHGALVSEVLSALACAGFHLEHVFDWVGKITPAGDIIAEAAASHAGDQQATDGPEAGAGAEADNSFGADLEPVPDDPSSAGAARGERPKLDLSANTKPKPKQRGNQKPRSKHKGQGRG